MPNRSRQAGEAENGRESSTSRSLSCSPPARPSICGAQRMHALIDGWRVDDHQHQIRSHIELVKGFCGVSHPSGTVQFLALDLSYRSLSSGGHRSRIFTSLVTCTIQQCYMAHLCTIVPVQNEIGSQPARLAVSRLAGAESACIASEIWLKAASP